jgi:hypothetical protein
MPLSSIQVEVLRLIAANRSPENYLAGATVLHRAEDSPRISQDLDFFHDVAESVATSAEADAATLRSAEYEVEWTLRTPTFYRAAIKAGADQLKIEWAQDSAFRFFPVQADDKCGYRLQDADAAINKVLALAGRSEARDFVDVLHLHSSYLSLGAMAWAACGKDPGFTPEFLLDQAGRHVAYSQHDIDSLQLRTPLDIKLLKKEWIAALEEAKEFCSTLPAEEVGCLYLDGNQKPLTPNPKSNDFYSLTRHWGSIRGAWPAVSEI